jgi:hypothetical protein
VARDAWQVVTPEMASQAHSDRTRSIETKRRHTLENRDRDLQVVQDLEQKLEVKERWTPGCPEWQVAAEMVGKRRYQRCLDSLEGLVVSRMFELTKMNMSQTGVLHCSI